MNENLTKFKRIILNVSELYVDEERIKRKARSEATKGSTIVLIYLFQNNVTIL
jgi:hypothetical protein